MASITGLNEDQTILRAADLKRISTWSPSVFLGLVRFFDAFVLAGAGVAAAFLRFENLEEVREFAPLQALTVLIALNLFHYRRVYRFGNFPNLYRQVRKVAEGWSIAILALTALVFANKTGAEYSRLWVGYWYVIGFAGLVCVRLVAARLLDWGHARGRFYQYAAIVGTREEALRLIGHLHSQPDNNMKLAGLYLDNPVSGEKELAGVPILGSSHHIGNAVHALSVDRVLLALPWEASQEIHAHLDRLRALPVDVQLMPPPLAYELADHSVEYVNGVPTLKLMTKPLTDSAVAIKRAADIVLSLLILLAALPVMLLVALAIKVSSPGPVLFKQDRYGFGNSVFRIFKFRTMYHAACTDPNVPQATRQDARVTCVGRFLRRTSLDELPQVFNVLKGDMSLVGPRPHARAHNEHYAQLIDMYLARHKVKPGITGWAQVNGLRGETDTLDKMEKRIAHDLHYVDNWSLRFDLKILLMTLFKVIGRNAY